MTQQINNSTFANFYRIHFGIMLKLIFLVPTNLSLDFIFLYNFYKFFTNQIIQSIKMQKEQELQQFSNYKHDKYDTNDEQQPQIGTEILDPTLPSDLDFDKKSPQKDNQNQQMKFQNAIPISKPYRKQSFEDEGLLQSYTVKGKSMFNMEPKYERGKLISHVPEELIQVKLYDEQKTSSGLKRFWEAVVGYIKREITFTQGYFYVFQRRNEGLFVAHSWKLVNLFKIFIDQEQSKIRFVFTQDEKIISKDMGVKNIKQTMEKLLDQLHKVGLKLQGQN